MEELKQQLMDQLGLDDPTSGKAIEIVLGFIKDQLPEGMQGMVDNLIDGAGDGLDAGDALNALKGMLGGD